MTVTRRKLLAGLLVLVSACSPSDTGGGTSSLADPPSTSVAPTSPSTIEPTSSSSTLDASTTTTLAGQEVDTGPRAGSSLAVIGVEFDDVLNVRAGPGLDSSKIGEAGPTATELIAQGHTRAMGDGSLWTEVSLDEVVGWVHMGYVAYLSDTEDATAAVVSSLGEYPTTESLEVMGRIVASVFASAEPPSRVVMITTSAPGSMQDITFDVIGVKDDATAGYRIQVFAAPVSDGLGFHSAEMTILCWRGVTGDGSCV